MEVRFWLRGNPQAHSGFTVDVSRSGMFLGTSVALKPGERLRLELIDRENGFMVEGEVARVHRVSAALRHVQQPGVGVRFLPPADLVGELLRTGRKRPETLTLSQVRFDRGASVPGSEPLSGGARPSVGESPPKPGEAGIGDLGLLPEPRVVPVEFVDRASFLAVYHRDIAAGGLFVTSDEPAPLHTTVTIELRPPVPVPQPLRFEARVVHRFDGGGEEGRERVSGMGVQFLDPDRVRATLAPIVLGLRR